MKTTASYKYITLLLSVFIIVNFSNAQNNLIQNGDFEIGQAPSGNGQIKEATGWSKSYVSPNFCTFSATPDLFAAASNCAVGVPLNKWSLNRPPVKGTRYSGFADSEPIWGTLNQTLAAGCYNLSFHIAAANGFDYCNTVTATFQPNYKIEVRLVNSTNCNSELIYTTKFITKKEWQEFNISFILDGSQAALGFDKIEFKSVGKSLYTGTITYLDNTTLTSSLSVTPTVTIIGPVTQQTPISYVNERIFVSGNWKINANTVFSNCELYMSPLSTIIVKPGVTLIIYQSTLQSSCEMWNGIHVFNGGVVDVRESEIYDAFRAIQIDGQNATYKVWRSTFERNLVHIYVYKGGSNKSEINSSTLSHFQVLKSPSVGVGGRGVVGIYVYNTTFLNVGGTPIAPFPDGKNNFFKGIYGVWCENSSAEIKENHFDGIYVAVYGDAKGGDRSVHVVDNTFSNLPTAVNLHSGINSDILGNIRHYSE